MNKKEKIVIYLIFIYIITVLLYFIYRMNQPPVYDQDLFDEIYSKYEDSKDDKNDEYSLSSSSEINPTYITVKAQENEYKVIGSIIIDKIDVNYPIISDTTFENLQIAPTKLCGPLINTTGNLCIIGHNYVNGKLFSNLSKLQENDVVTVLDNNENAVDYTVYDKYIVKDDDVTCMNQDTNGATELTLITCTNKHNERLIVKCRS